MTEERRRIPPEVYAGGSLIWLGEKRKAEILEVFDEVAERKEQMRLRRLWERQMEERDRGRGDGED